MTMPTLLQPPIWTIAAWSANVVDSNGCMWVSPTSTGWFDPLPVRGSDIDISTEDGSYSTPTTRGERVITIPGYTKAPTSAAADAAADQFTGLLATGGLQQLSVQENTRTLTAMVKLGNGGQLDRTSQCGFEWQLVLIAPDPSRYLAVPAGTTSLPMYSGGKDYTGGGAGGVDYTGGGAGGINYGTVTSTGLIQLTNTGPAKSWPQFTITGPTDGTTLVAPSIVEVGTNRTLAYSGTLTTGDRLVITTRPGARSVLLNNVSYRRFLTSAQWFAVPPGASTQVQFQGTAPTVTSQLSALLPAAY
jgi:hypothetical protein